MEQKRLLLIINPVSGTHGKQDVADVVRQILEPHGCAVEAVFTQGAGDATTLARGAVGSGFDGVLVAGGDGTVNEAARGIYGSGLPLGILPCGSGNGLARHLRIPIDVAKAIEIVTDDNVVDADYGMVNDNPFFCTFGVGFDAAVSQRFSHQPRRGRITYIKSVLREFIHYSPQDYTILLPDGKILVEKAFLVAVCNASQYGNNAYIAPRASIVDGLLDITIVHSGSPLTTAMVGVDLMTGFIDRNMLIDSFRAEALTITRTTPGPVHIDGEPMVFNERMDIRCHRGGLRLFAPLADKPFKPIITPVQSMIQDITTDLRHIINRQ